MFRAKVGKGGINTITCSSIFLPKIKLNTVKPVLSRRSKRSKNVFKTNYGLMQVKSIGEHSAILSTFIKLPFVIKIFFFSFEWPLKTSFAVTENPYL